MNSIFLWPLILAGFLLYPPGAWSQISETPFAMVEEPVDVEIPDNDIAGVTRVLTVPGSAPLQALEATVKIEHPAVEQLRITLTSPNGTVVLLHDRTEHEGEIFNPIYERTTEAAEPLNPFLGKEAQGEWTLNVSDQVEQRTGALLAWGLRLKPADLSRPPVEPIPIRPVDFIPLQPFSAIAPISGADQADINGDGLADLLLLSEAQNQVLIHLSTGGSLEPLPLEVDVESPQKITVADLNNDGIADMVVASQDALLPLTDLSVFLGTEEGVLAPGFTAQVDTRLDVLDAFDYNGDGVADIVLGGEPIWLPGVGDGSFAPPQEVIPQLGRQLLAVGDINQDGRSDLLLTISRGGTSRNADPHVLLNFGTPLEDDRVKFSFANDVTHGFLQGTLARIDNPDAEEYILLSDTGEADPTFWFTRVRRSDAGEVFSQITRLSGEAINAPFDAIDLNGDRLTDFVFAATSGVRVFQPAPNNLGGETREIFLLEETRFTQPGFYLENGLPGIAAVDAQNWVTLIQINANAVITPTPTLSPTPTPTSIAFPTLTPTPSPTPPSSPAPTLTPTLPPPAPGSPDLNGDGVVDKLDLLILIEHWGEAQ